MIEVPTTPLTVDRLMELIDRELCRQSQDARPDTPYLHNRFGDLQGIDGYVDIRKLAQAIFGPEGAGDRRRTLPLTL